jgi:hypothetical protein
MLALLLAASVITGCGTRGQPMGWNAGGSCTIVAIGNATKGSQTLTPAVTVILDVKSLSELEL